MAIDIGLDDAARKSSAEALKALLGETYALYTKTHGYHWNVTGPRFNELHNMFMVQYNELWLALDLIAERIRALGHFAPGSSGEIAIRGPQGRYHTNPGPDTQLAEDSVIIALGSASELDHLRQTVDGT